MRSRESEPKHFNLAPAIKKLLALVTQGQKEEVVYICEPAAILELILGATTYKVLSEPVLPIMTGKRITTRFQNNLNKDVMSLLNRAILC